MTKKLLSLALAAILLAIQFLSDIDFVGV